MRWKATFRKDLKRNRMNQAERVTADTLGRFGMFARGVVFTMLALFVLLAGLHNSAGEAHGMGPVFQVIAREPAGHAMLAVVALGFIALGMHSIANAAWVRMPKGN